MARICPSMRTTWSQSLSHTRAAEQTNAYVLPCINYGCSAVFRHFPGTIPVRQETLANVIRDVCQSLIAQGFRRFIFVDNHGGNEAVGEHVAREVKAAHGIVIGSIYPWNLGYGLMRDTYENPEAAYGHGAEPETSAMLATFPDDVVRDRIAAGAYQPYAGWQMQSYNKVIVPGQPLPATIYLDANDVMPNGSSGDPREVSPERGALWIARVVGFAVSFIRQDDTMTAHADWARLTGSVPAVQ